MLSLKSQDEYQEIYYVYPQQAGLHQIHNKYINKIYITQGGDLDQFPAC